MASNIPAGLKSADIAKYAARAAQLQKIKPVVAYWCEMRMLNQIISKGLHNADNECLQYTTALMDKLEQTKAENSTNDAIVDNAAGQAYVEQFALEVFQRAEKAVQADKVTKQTAETFQAAAIFLEVLKEWGDLDPEIQAKIKYAKWNALRIVKAIKEGKDPNESNPKPEPAPEENLPALDPNDPDVMQLGGGGQSRQATVEDAPDEEDHIQSHPAPQSAHDQSLHPSGQAPATESPGISPASGSKFDPYPRDGFPYNIATTNNDVSPPDPSPNRRNDSLGGGYFPAVPTFMSDTRAPTLPTAPPESTIDLESTPDLPDSSKLPPPGLSDTGDFRSFPPPDIKDDEIIPPPPPSPPQDFYRQDPPSQQYLPPPPQPPQQQFNPTPVQPHHYQAPPAQIPATAPPPVLASRQQVLNTDEEAVAKAQKHARWAISALNFEDAETAVRELRAALATLGAQ